MYDTLKLWLPSYSIAEPNYTDRLTGLLDNATQHTKEDNSYITGNYKGLIICSSDSGVSLKGSLAKYYLNDNIKTLTRQDTQRAIEKLEDSFCLPINEAIVSRIDLAQSFIVNHKPELYYDFLGDSNHYKRLVQPKSIYYSNGLRTKLFYNKVAEAKSKSVQVPAIWQGANVLRYELRFMSRLPKQFNVCKVFASNLYEEQFYINLIDKWFNEYEAINKLNEINLNYDIMNKPNDFIKQMAAKYVESIGGQNEAFKLVELAKANKCFKHPEYYILKEIFQKFLPIFYHYCF